MIAAGVVLYGLYFIADRYHFLKSPGPVQKTDFSSIDHEKKVNEILQATTRQMLKDQYNSRKVLEMAQRQPLKLNKEKDSEIGEVPREQQIHKNVTVEPVEALKPAVLDKAEYARQYIENARKGGYDIELSNDLEVIRVTPLRHPSEEVDSFEILPSN